MSWLRFLPLDIVVGRSPHPVDWEMTTTYIVIVAIVLVVAAGIVIVRLVRNKIQKQEIAEIQRNAQRESDKTEG